MKISLFQKPPLVHLSLECMGHVIVDERVDGGVDIAESVTHQLTLSYYLVQDDSRLLRQTVKVGVPEVIANNSFLWISLNLSGYINKLKI